MFGSAGFPRMDSEPVSDRARHYSHSHSTANYSHSANGTRNTMNCPNCLLPAANKRPPTITAHPKLYLAWPNGQPYFGVRTSVRTHVFVLRVPCVDCWAPTARAIIRKRKRQRIIRIPRTGPAIRRIAPIAPCQQDHCRTIELALAAILTIPV